MEHLEVEYRDGKIIVSFAANGIERGLGLKYGDHEILVSSTCIWQARKESGEISDVQVVSGACIEVSELAVRMARHMQGDTLRAFGCASYRNFCIVMEAHHIIVNSKEMVMFAASRGLWGLINRSRCESRGLVPPGLYGMACRAATTESWVTALRVYVETDEWIPVPQHTLLLLLLTCGLKKISRAACHRVVEDLCRNREAAILRHMKINGLLHDAPMDAYILMGNPEHLIQRGAVFRIMDPNLLQDPGFVALMERDPSFRHKVFLRTVWVRNGETVYMYPEGQIGNRDTAEFWRTLEASARIQWVSSECMQSDPCQHECIVDDRLIRTYGDQIWAWGARNGFPTSVMEPRPHERGIITWRHFSEYGRPPAQRK
jgi:hypothetical protein